MVLNMGSLDCESSALTTRLYLTNFYKKYLQDLKCNVKKVNHLILFGVLSILILSVKNRRVGRGANMLNGQNSLSVTKVVCWRSLTVQKFPLWGLNTLKILWFPTLCQKIQPGLSIWTLEGGHSFPYALAALATRSHA